ncbi:MAG: hypothetical protein U9N59_06795 [Campylobacterota bacterium]|nr:hypothetical protein [Campylobacterota bacterium]
MQMWLSLFLSSFILIGCGSKTNNISFQAHTYKNDAIFLYKQDKEKQAIVSLEKALEIYKSVDNIDSQVETLLLLLKITDNTKYLKSAQKFLGVSLSKIDDKILFAKALYSMDEKLFLKFKNSEDDEIKTLSLLYLYKLTKEDKYLKQISYSKKDFVYSFYLVTLFDVTNDILLLKEALSIDKKLESKRFIKRDLEKLSLYYKDTDTNKSNFYRQRADAIN